MEARNTVMVTDVKRKQFAQAGWGELDINCGSFKQTSRQIAKKGSKHPLKTWATRIT